MFPLKLKVWCGCRYLSTQCVTCSRRQSVLSQFGKAEISPAVDRFSRKTSCRHCAIHAILQHRSDSRVKWWKCAHYSTDFFLWLKSIFMLTLSIAVLCYASVLGSLFASPNWEHSVGTLKTPTILFHAIKSSFWYYDSRRERKHENFIFSHNKYVAVITHLYWIAIVCLLV